MITSLSIKNFSAFEDVHIQLDPKINVIIGENSTGKTHMLKALYVMCSEFKSLNPTEPLDNDVVRSWLTDRFVNVFKPLNNGIGRLAKTGAQEETKLVIEYTDSSHFGVSFGHSSKFVNFTENQPIYSNLQESHNPVFIPAKEILSIMLGLRSVIQSYKLSFDETYSDLINLLELPERRPDALGEKALWVMKELEKRYGGKFRFLGGGHIEFKVGRNKYSVNTMAEGFRKLGTLFRLLETGAIDPSRHAPLIWDEPDANLNPLLIELLVDSLLKLSREGQQIIIATHNYNLIKWIDMKKEYDRGDSVRFHSLYRDTKKNTRIQLEFANELPELKNNPILESFRKIVDFEIVSNLGGLGK